MMLHSRAVRLPCGCRVSLNDNLTNDTWLALDIAWCRVHRMVTVRVPEPKSWDSRDHPTKIAKRR